MSRTISAVIPTYNRARFICEAIDSVLAQSVPVSEIVVVDDGSTDQTAELIKSYGDRVRYIYQQNRGPGAARNRGVAEARCDWVALLDSDDLWMVDKVRLQSEFLDQHPEIDFVFGDMANFSAENPNFEPEIKNAKMHDYLVSNAGYLEKMLDCLIIENVVPTPTIMFRRACAGRIGTFDEGLRIAEDLDYWLRAALTCRWGFVPVVLARRRRHETNLINNWVQMMDALSRVLQRLVPIELPPETRRLLGKKLFDTHYDLGSRCLRQKEFGQAYEYLRREVNSESKNWRWYVKFALASLLNRGSGRSARVLAS